MIRAACLALALGLLRLATGGSAARAEIDVVSVTSPGGIESWLYEDHTLPILSIDASFLGGATLDPEGRRGTAALLAALLDEGAGGLDSAAFATALEDLAADIGFATSDDDVRLSATMLTDTRDATTDLLRLALTEPRFDAEPVERLRAQTLASIRQKDADPRTRAGAELYVQAFPGHPYGSPTSGSAESVAAITVADLRAVHGAALTRARLRVAVVGDITAEELRPLLDRIFGALPETGPELPAIVEPHMSGETTVLDFDTPQSVVFFGNAGLLNDDPDIIPALVMNYVLAGGGLSTRLSEALRVKRGLTYGVYTWLASGEFGALYMGTFSTSNAQAAEAIAVLRDEWARMAEGGISEAELASAKRYLTGEFPLRFNGTQNIAAQLLGLQLGGHDIGYVRERRGLIEAVTVEDVARVARRLLLPEELTLVIAGRPERVAPRN